MIPCRHIPFNVSGETLDSLYRYSDQNEIEETVGGWLRTTIQRLKEERTVGRQAHKQPSPGGGMLIVPTATKCMSALPAKRGFR
jgi:hypothetical protein